MDNELLLKLINSDEPLEPETVYQFFPNLTPLEVQKIQVMKVIRDTAFVHEDMDVFENAVQVINNISPDVSSTNGCKPEWIWFATIFIERIRHRIYSNEVLEYIKWNFNDAGLKFYPPIFSGDKNPLLKEVMYKAVKGPFPLKETFLDIQTLGYLKIQEYIKNKSQ